MTSILPYLNLENFENIASLSGDPIIASRLQYDDPNGFLWQYLYKEKLSRILPSDLTQSLKDRYYEYLEKFQSYTSQIALDSLLNKAVKKGYEILVANLMMKGASPYRWWDTFEQAIENRRLDIIKCLMICRADERQDIIDHFKWESLRHAAIRGHSEIVTYFVSEGANIYESEALQYAAAFGYMDIVRYLVDIGADIHMCEDDALFQAVASGHTDIIRYLVSHGANIGAHKNKAIRRALKNGYYEIAAYLVETSKLFVFSK